MNYFAPLALSSSGLQDVSAKLAEWLKGTADGMQDAFAAAPLEKLKQAADDAVQNLKKDIPSAADRQRAVHACALYRDMAYSHFTRGKLLAAGVSGQLGELIELAIAAKFHVE